MKVLIAISLLLAVFLSYPVTIKEIPIDIIDLPVDQAQDEQLLANGFLSKKNASEQIFHTQNKTQVFVGNLSVGTPSQYIPVSFDTNYPLTWINSVECTSPDCYGKPAYNNSQSKTFKNMNFYYQVHQAYGDKHLVSRGVQGKDTITIGGRTVANQVFGQSLYTNSQYAGVLGLSPQDSNVVNQGYLQGQFDSSSFSIYVQNGSKAPQSAIVFGGANNKYIKSNWFGQRSSFLYSPIVYNETYNYYQWQVRFQSLSVNNTNVTLNNAQIDTGNKEIQLFSYWSYNSILRALGLQNTQGIPKYVVDRLPALKFQVKGQVLSLESQYYTSCNGNTCQLLIKYNSEINMDKYDVYLGTCFMQKYYTHLDYQNKRIGFVESVSN